MTKTDYASYPSKKLKKREDGYKNRKRDPVLERS